jgi:hypothetical protein
VGVREEGWTPWRQPQINTPLCPSASRNAIDKSIDLAVAICPSTSRSTGHVVMIRSVRDVVSLRYRRTVVERPELA